MEDSKFFLMQQFWEACKLGHYEEVRKFLKADPAIVNKVSKGCFDEDTETYMLF